MKLSFPNPSRSFDPVKNRIQFWGYLESIEISFTIDAAALLKLRPDSKNNKDGLLAAFDSCVGEIRTVADKEYLRSGSKATSYWLAVSAF